MKLSLENMSEKEIRSTMQKWLEDYKPLLLQVYNVIIETASKSRCARVGEILKEIKHGNVNVICLKSSDVYNARKGEMVFKNRITVYVGNTMVALLEWASSAPLIHAPNSFVRPGDWRASVESILQEGMKKLEDKRAADELESRMALLEKLHASEDL